MLLRLAIVDTVSMSTTLISIAFFSFFDSGVVGVVVEGVGGVVVKGVGGLGVECFGGAELEV